MSLVENIERDIIKEKGKMCVQKDADRAAEQPLRKGSTKNDVVFNVYDQYCQMDVGRDVFNALSKNEKATFFSRAPSLYFN